MDNWEEKIRNGGDVPASEFTSVKEMINPFSHLQQQLDRDHIHESRKCEAL
jgi:hypothetical protein